MTLIEVENPPVVYLSESEDELGERCKLDKLKFHLNDRGMITLGYIVVYQNRTKEIKTFKFFHMSFLLGAVTIKNTFPEVLVVAPNKRLEVTYDLSWISDDIGGNEYIKPKG